MFYKFISIIFRTRWLHHLVFWLLSGYILLYIFAGSDYFKPIDFIYTSIFMVSILIPVSLNHFVFIPKLLNHKKYVAYFILFLTNLFGFTLFNQVLFNQLIDLVLPGYYFISYYSYFEILQFFAVFLALTTLLHLSKEWFELNETRHRIILLEKEKITAELKALMNQVNPHFLFNSLNVLYSLAMKKRNETPEAILKLSDILRYVIYESNKNWVELQSEINLIHNYIELQKFRVEDKAHIEFSESIEKENIRIAPMLFLPLIENAYKHGIKGDIENTFLKMDLVGTLNEIQFKIMNNIGDQIQKDKKGVGLSNVKNRLELIYPDKHEFIIEENETTFMVNLKIQL